MSRDENLLDDYVSPEDYVDLTPALSAAIDLHGARARRRHVAQAVLRSLGYVPDGVPGRWTLLAFSWIGDEIARLLQEQLVPVEAKARAIASRVADVRDPASLEADLGIRVRVDGDWTSTAARRVAIVDDLFPRLRRFLRRLVDEGALQDTTETR